MSDETGAMNETKRNEIQAQWISVQEAAKLLGISNRAVQTRAQRSQIVSKRQGRQWLICLDTDLQAEGQAQRNEPSFSATDATSATQAQPDATQQAQSDVVELLKSENAFLRVRTLEHEAEIRRRDQADSEFRRLLLSRDMEIVKLQGEVQKLLTSGPVTVEAEPAVQDSAESHQEAHTAQELAKVEERTPEEIQGPDTGRRRHWWEVWKR